MTRGPAGNRPAHARRRLHHGRVRPHHHRALPVAAGRRPDLRRAGTAGPLAGRTDRRRSGAANLAARRAAGLRGAARRRPAQGHPLGPAARLLRPSVRGGPADGGPAPDLLRRRRGRRAAALPDRAELQHDRHGHGDAPPRRRAHRDHRDCGGGPGQAAPRRGPRTHADRVFRQGARRAGRQSSPAVRPAHAVRGLRAAGRSGRASTGARRNGSAPGLLLLQGRGEGSRVPHRPAQCDPGQLEPWGEPARRRPGRGRSSDSAGGRQPGGCG